VKGFALFWPFLIECLAFFSNFVGGFWPFLLEAWPCLKNKSGNSASNFNNQAPLFTKLCLLQGTLLGYMKNKQNEVSQDS